VMSMVGASPRPHSAVIALIASLRLLRVDVVGFLVQRALLVEHGGAWSSGVRTGRNTV